MSTTPTDLRIETWPPYSQGVRITHKPTGMTAEATESRNQMVNRNVALDRLQAKLDALRSGGKET